MVFQTRAPEAGGEEQVGVRDGCCSGSALHVCALSGRPSPPGKMTFCDYKAKAIHQKHRWLSICRLLLRVILMASFELVSLSSCMVRILFLCFCFVLFSF